MKRLAPITMLLAFVIAGCSNTTTHRVIVQQKVVTITTPVAAEACPPGQSQMGCAITPPSKPTTSQLSRPAGPLVPDVSNWQGTVNWSAVKAWQLSHGWTPAGIFKMGEFVGDSFAESNSAALHARHMWLSGYWFVRNTGCGHESAQILGAARTLGVKVVTLDIEVPEAAGYGHCLSAPLRAAGLVVVIYAGTGTWPGGPNDNLPLWIASYGSSFGCLWTCKPVAWQFTDGHFGIPVFVPGIGQDDVSVDYGLTKLGVPSASAAQIKKWKGALASSQRQYNRRGCGTLAQRERWFGARLHGRLATKRRHALTASRAAYRNRSCATFDGRVHYYTRRLHS